MLKLSKPEKGSKSQHVAFCNLPYTKLILNSWGDVSMCCHQIKQLGRLDGTTEVLDLWNSDLAKSIRQKTSNGQLHPACLSGKSCPFMSKEKIAHPIPVYDDFAYPTYLEICLPDKHCNVGGENPSEKNPACIMCKRNFRTPKQKDITDFLCLKSRPLFPHLEYFCVMGIAEPFWKNAVFKMLEKVSFEKYREHIQFTTNTNGICLNEKEARYFFEHVSYSRLSWSLDAATPETHVKIRRLDALDLVVKNLKRWMSLREQYGGKRYHKVSIYNNINLLNVHEMVQMVEMAADIGVDNMIMLPTYEQNGIVQLGELVLCDKNVHVFKDASEKAMKRAGELGVTLIYENRFDVAPNAELVQLRL